jgi:hypothetical protein
MPRCEPSSCLCAHTKANATIAHTSHPFQAAADLCPICLSVVVDPTTLCKDIEGTRLCNKGSKPHIYCYLCIKAWMKMDNTCCMCKGTAVALQHGEKKEPVEEKKQRADDEDPADIPDPDDVCYECREGGLLMICECCERSAHYEVFSVILGVLFFDLALTTSSIFHVHTVCWAALLA